MIRSGETAGCHAAADVCGTELADAIDLEHLSRYTLGNQALQREVLALFRTRSEFCLRRLEQAIDAEAWADAAHTLKGSARSIGAKDVARCAEDAERLSGGLHSTDYRSALYELNRLVAEANRAIDRMLGDSAADS